jgi:hypothetical protein
MRIRVEKNKLKIAAETLIQKVISRREELKKEAIDIITSHKKPNWKFWEKERCYTTEEAVEILKLSLMDQLDTDEKVARALNWDQSHSGIFCDGAINLANSLVWACNNSEDGVVILEAKEIECFESWKINIQ